MVRSKKIRNLLLLGTDWGQADDSTVHQNACPLFLNQLVTKKHFVSCLVATNRLLRPLSTDIFSQQTVFLILRNGTVAGEQLLYNHLPSFLCVLSWNWCLNSFWFVRLHWFCSSPESWLCTGRAYSWAKGYHCWSGVSYIVRSLIYIILYQFQAVLRTSWNRTLELRLCLGSYSLFLQTLPVFCCCGMLPVKPLPHSLSLNKLLLITWSFPFGEFIHAILHVIVPKWGEQIHHPSLWKKEV